MNGDGTKLHSEPFAKDAPAAEAYEAPRVELVLDADSLQREVHYAGEPSDPA